MHDEKAIKDMVRKRYGTLAAEGQACCGPREGQGEADRSCGLDYSPEEFASLDPAVISVSLGCGNPSALAELRAGEVVLDLGSGGGIDVFLAARKVGPSGRVIGIDMTDQMLERARQAAAAMGIANAEFRRGDIAAIPLEDESVDVVISNCVINLAPDKSQIFREAYRVLRPGGRMVLSDVVSNGPLPPSIRSDPKAWTRCVGGALEEREYLDLIQAAGFRGVQVLSRRGQAAPGEVFSISVRARKAASPLLGEPQGPGEGTSLLSPRDRALIAVGVARTVCSETGLRSHIEEAKKLGWSTDPLDAKNEELIAIGAALAANCEPCLRYHVRRGAEVGCTREAMCRAVEIAQGVKDTPARLLASLASRLLATPVDQPALGDPCAVATGHTTSAASGSCCGPGTSDREEYDRGRSVGQP